MEEFMNIKKQLHTKCMEYVNKRILTVREAMKAVKEAVDEETKSVLGDKYETGRAMLQLELENYSSQLIEARRLYEQMEQISPKSICRSVQSGCLVFTSQGNYYFAVSAGKVTIAGKDYFAVAPTSPIGNALLERKEGEEAELNGRRFVISKIY
jgi:hypothetical protein